MSNEDTLDTLFEKFPNFNRESIAEVFILTAGNISQAEAILKDQISYDSQPKLDQEKEKLHSGNQLNSEYIPIEKDNDSLKESKVDLQPVDVQATRQYQTKGHASCEISQSEDKTDNQIPDVVKKRKLQSSLPFYSQPKKLKQEITNRTITLHTIAEIEAHIPSVKVFKNFLPNEISDLILDELITKRMIFLDKEFYIAGKLCRPSQKSIMFATPEHINIDHMYTSNDIKIANFFPQLYTVKCYVDAKVNELLDNLKEKHPYQIQKNWKADFCVGNYFPNNKSHLDWHTDKLSNIGPLPTIASLSFGATRIFRLRPITPSNSVIYDIALPNNTLLVMLPSTQELYKHNVPTLTYSLVDKHPKSNEGRFSLTFRKIHPILKQNRVSCDKCNSNMLLRRLFKKNEDEGYYVWMCNSSYKGKECFGFKYAQFDQLYELMNGGDGSSNFNKTDPPINLVAKSKSDAARWLG
ncbi:hypothetical protein DAMA08_003080 [Martiniozyma asiatica (nom. inval.)]|nr:hypothetical protein DAMA08_003080 [Martiniozyma asiatica]